MKLSAAQVRAYLKRLDELGSRNLARLEALLGVLDGDGQATVASVLDRVFAGAGNTRDSRNRAFNRLREEFDELAAEKKLDIRLQVSGAKSLGSEGRLVWFEGETLLNVGHTTEELARVESRLITDNRGLPLNPEPRLALSERTADGKPVVRWFFSYAHADKKALTLFKKLKTALTNSPRYRFEPWSDQHIVVGENWHGQIQTALQRCHLGVLALSHDFLVSDYVTRNELPVFVDGQDPRASGKRAIPVALEAFDFDYTDLKGLQAQQIYRDDELKSFAERSGARQTQWVNRLVKQIHALLQRHADEPGAASSAALPTDKLPLRLHARHMLSRDLADNNERLVCDTRAQPTTLDRQLLDRGNEAQRTEDSGVDALAYLLDWAADPGAPGLFALLAEYGMGKTITCQRLVRAIEEKRKEQAEKQRTDADWPQALYFDLRKLTGLRSGPVPTLDEIVDECIQRGWTHDGTPPTAEELIGRSRQHAQLWVFDGLDEALVHLSEVDGQNFTRELLRLQARTGAPWHPGTKLLISCRTHYFRSLQAQNNHFTGQDRDTTPASDYRALLLLPLSEEQVRNYLQHALPGLDADATLAMVKEVHNLSELASRPYTLRLVSEFIPQIERWRAEGRPVFGVTLYRQMVQSWMHRDSGKHHLKPEHKARLMTHLAAWMWRRGQRLIPAAELEPWFLAWLDEQPELRLRYRDYDRDKLEEDLRTATFLVREDGNRHADAGEEADDDSGTAGATGGFRFAHTSMQEYFLAVYLFDAIKENRRQDWALPLVSVETRRFLAQCLQEDGRRQGIDRLSGWRSPYLAQASEQWLRYGLDAVAESWPAPSLAGVDMHGARLHGWEFVGRNANEPLNLIGADFTHCELRETRWRHVRLDDARMQSALLDRCEWLEVAAPRADLRKTTFHGARLRQVTWGGAVLDESQGTLAWAPGVEPKPQWAKAVGASRSRFHPTLGHSSFVDACAFSPDGSRIVSASYDHTLRLWDANSGCCIAVWQGHSGGINACAFSPDGNRVVSASDDKTLRLWDSASGTCLAVWRGHSDGVNACAFSPDDTRVVSGSWDQTLRLWDSTSGSCIGVWRGHSGVVGACVFSPDGSRVVSASWDNTLRLWDSTSGSCLSVWQGHSDWVRDCAFSPDGARVVSASHDRTLRLWDSFSGSCIGVWHGHSDRVHASAFSPDGSRVVSASYDKTLRLWDSSSGSCIAVWQGHTDPVRACAFSPDGTHVVSASRGTTVRLWDASSGSCIANWQDRCEGVEACTYSPDGSRFVSASRDGRLRLWHSSSGAQIAAWQRHSNWVSACAFSPDGTRVVSASWDNTLRLWDSSSGTRIAVWQGHTAPVKACAFSPDGTRVVSASWDQTLRVWDSSSGTCIAVWRGHSDLVMGCAFSPDGSRVVSAGRDETLRVWDSSSGDCLAVWQGHTHAVTTCAFSPYGSRVVSADVSGYLRVWDASSGDCIAVLRGHTRPVNACAFSPDGTRVVSASRDNTLRVWDSSSGDCLAVWQGHSASVSDCAFSPDGTRVLSASADGSLREWDAASGECLRVYQTVGDSHAVWEPGSQRLISASEGAWRWLGMQLRDDQDRILDLRPIEEFYPLPYPPSGADTQDPPITGTEADVLHRSNSSL